MAGYINQAANSIIINATGTALNNTTTSGLFVKPISYVQAGVPNASPWRRLLWNETTGEIVAVNQ
jgi:hypothetical protein